MSVKLNAFKLFKVHFIQF